MARQHDIQLSGAVDNVIFFRRYGVGFIRSKPIQVKQTVATKQMAAMFGLATTMGRCIRQQLQPILPNPKDRQMQNAVRLAIQQWLIHREDIQHNEIYPNPLLGFELNSQSSLQHLLKAKLQASYIHNNEVVIALPAIVATQQIKAPKKTQYVELKLMAIHCNINNPEQTNSVYSSINIPYIDTLLPAKNIVLPLQATSNSLVLLATGLLFKDAVNGTGLNNLKWMPLQIVGVWNI